MESAKIEWKRDMDVDRSGGARMKATEASKATWSNGISSMHVSRDWSMMDFCLTSKPLFDPEAEVVN